jgi:hypothetical protein
MSTTALLGREQLVRRNKGLKLVNKRIALSKRELRSAQHRFRQLGRRIAGLCRDGCDTSEAAQVLGRLKAAIKLMRRNHERLCAELGVRVGAIPPHHARDSLCPDNAS